MMEWNCCEGQQRPKKHRWRSMMKWNCCKGQQRPKKLGQVLRVVGWRRGRTIEKGVDAFHEAVSGNGTTEGRGGDRVFDKGRGSHLEQGFCEEEGIDALGGVAIGAQFAQEKQFLPEDFGFGQPSRNIAQPAEPEKESGVVITKMGAFVSEYGFEAIAIEQVEQAATQHQLRFPKTDERAENKGRIENAGIAPENFLFGKVVQLPSSLPIRARQPQPSANGKKQKSAGDRVAEPTARGPNHASLGAHANNGERCREKQQRGQQKSQQRGLPATTVAGGRERLARSPRNRETS